MNPAAWWLLLAFADSPPLDGARFYQSQVAPIFARHCIACHNNELDDGDISFENRATLVKERKSRGPAVVPGDPENSPLIQAVRHDGDIQMPPGKKLSDSEIATLIEWIKRGAPWSKR